MQHTTSAQGGSPNLGWSAPVALIEVIAGVAGFVSAASQNWTIALISGAIAILFSLVFILVFAPRLSRWMIVVAVLPVMVGSGLVGAAAGNAFSPRTVVAERDSEPTETSTTTTTSVSDATTTTTTSTTTSTTTPTSSTPPGEFDADRRFLSDMEPLNTNAVDSPKPVTIGTDTYPNSFTLGCDTGGNMVTYPVAGYALLTARLGLDNNQSGSAAQQGYKSVVRVTANGVDQQLGDEYTVSLGNPMDLEIMLNGAIQITITCTLINPSGSSRGYYQLAFANAAVSK